MERRCDYSQTGDPYGIWAEYTAQSATLEVPRWNKVGGDRDIRGNSLIQPRSVPTQAEADAIKREV